MDSSLRKAHAKIFLSSTNYNQISFMTEEALSDQMAMEIHSWMPVSLFL